MNLKDKKFIPILTALIVNTPTVILIACGLKVMGALTIDYTVGWYVRRIRDKEYHLTEKGNR